MKFFLSFPPKLSLLIFTTSFTVLFYTQTVCRRALLDGFQTRQLFCAYVVLMLLEVGALTATLPPIFKEENKLQPDNASVSRNDTREEDSRAVTVKLAPDIRVSSRVKVSKRICALTF